MRILVQIALALATFSLTSNAAQDQEQILLWGFDRLAVSTSGKDQKDLVARGQLRNVVAVSRSGDLLSVVARPANAQGDGLSLVAIDSSNGAIRQTREIPGLARASISPDGKKIGLVTCGGSGCQFTVIEEATGRAVTKVKLEATSSATIAWHPSGNQVAFDTPGKATTVLSLLDGTTFPIKGSGPSWKPDGMALAVIDERSVRLVDLKTRSYSPIATRYPWQTEFVAPLSWRRDGAVLLANAPAGATGYKFDCFALDMPSGKVSTVFSGELVCGPWL